MQASRAFAAFAKFTSFGVFASLLGSAVAADHTVRVTVTDGTGAVLPNVTITYGSEKTATVIDGTAFIVTDLPKVSVQFNEMFVDLILPAGGKSTAHVVLEGGDASYKFTGTDFKDVTIPQAAPFSQIARWQTTTYSGATNDDCSGAVDIGNADGVYAFDSTTAGSVGPEACENFGTTGIDSDVWFIWSPPVDGDVTWNTCNGLAAGLDTKIAVYTGGCGGLVLEGCDDDGCSMAAPFDSSLTFSASASTSYLLRLGTFPGTAGAVGQFELTTAGAGGCVGMGGGDSCAGPEAITGEGDFCFDNNGDASNTPGSNSACPDGNNDRWYAWTAPSDGIATVSTCDGLSIDTIINVFSDGGCPPGFTGEIACNDDACGLQSSTGFSATAGTVYRIRISTFSGTAFEAGSFNISLQGMAAGCDTGVYCQNPDQLGHGGAGTIGATSDANPGAGFAVADNFQATADGTITDICWWGIYIDFGAGVGPCFAVPADSFTATYYADLDGGPGAVKAGPMPITITSSGLTGNIIPTGVGDIDEYIYSGSHNPVPVTAGECCWIEIQNNTTGSCFWLWETAAPGDAKGSQDGGAGHAPTDFDLAFCVDVEAGICDLPDGPGNDNCADCTPIMGTGNFAFSNATATTDGPEACDKFAAPQIDHDVWYCWTAPCTGEASVQTCGLTDVDTKIAVYPDGACPPVGGTEIACNDDTCGFQSLVTFDATSGTTYLIRIGTFQGEDGGTGEFAITCGTAVGPENDECADAIAVNVGDTVSGDTSLATFDDVGLCGTSNTAPGIWYSFVGTGTTVTLSTCNQAGYDTKIGVFCGDCDALTCVDGNDDGPGCGGFTSELSVCTTNGVTYLVLVHGFGTGTGAFDLTLTEDGMGCTATADCADVGACCASDGSCTVTTEDDCLAQGNSWKGVDTDCGGGGGYAFATSANSFVDVSGQGAILALGDDTSEDVAIGFNFNFFGTAQSNVTVASNGYLTFGADGGDFSNDPCGDALDPNDFIAPFWDDLSPNLGGTINAVTLGAPGNQRLMVQYTDVAFFSLPDTITFQVALFEADDSIEFRYLTVPDGTSATVGIENADASEFLCTDTTPASGDSLRIENDPGINPCVECFLVVGTNNSSGSFDGQVHTWNGLEVGNLVGSWAVTMEDLPLMPLNRVVRFAGSNQTRLRRSWGEEPEPAFFAQIVMWNPGIFPANPEQSTQGLAVYALPDGTVYGVPYGQQDGGMTWLDIRTLDINGETYFQIPFDISFQ